MRIVAVLTLLALFGTTAVVAQQPAQASTHEPSVTMIGPHPPVSSLQELWDRTPVVVLVAVRNALRPQVERGQIVTRFQIAEVMEVFKDTNDLLKGARQIRLKQYGGTAFDGEREVRTNFIADPLPVGSEAVLFLTPLDGGKAFEVPYGNTGIFAVTDKTAMTLSVKRTARHMPEFGGRSEISKDELVNIFRTQKQSNRWLGYPGMSGSFGCVRNEVT